MEYYSAFKKNEIIPYAAIWMDPEIVILSEVSQTEKEKYCMTYVYIRMLNLEINYTKKDVVHTYNGILLSHTRE